MESKARYLIAYAAVVAGLSGGKAQAADLTLDRLLAAQCAQCHGTNGHAVGDIEELAGMSYSELVEEMLEMRNEDRPNDIMEHQAMGYTEAQIRRIARYYSAIPAASGSAVDE